MRGGLGVTILKYRPAEIFALENIDPRKRVHWSGIIRPSAVEIKRQQTDLGTKEYIIALGSTVYEEQTISDFSLLSEIIEIGHWFAVQDSNNTASGVQKISDFITTHGFPFISAELQEMPKQEQLRLKNLDKEAFLGETSAWMPYDGCALSSFVLSAQYLYAVFDLWCQIKFSPYRQDCDKKSRILQNCIEHGNWNYFSMGATVTHKPQLTHRLTYSPKIERYIDYYESKNLFCIITDQLYSFIADYEAGAFSRIKECPICGRLIKVSRNQKYCKECSDAVKTQKSTERSRRYRSRQKADANKSTTECGN